MAEVDRANVVPPRPVARARRSGFTLVELLVVIGIIALLLSILLPSLSRAREQAKMVQCLSNLRQLGLAMTMYADSNKGRFPAPAVGALPDDWIYWQSGRDINDSVILPYLGGKFNWDFFRCPADNPDTHPAGAYSGSYTVNELICNWFNRQAGKPVILITQIRHPAQKILIIDESSQTIDDACWAPQNYSGDGHNLLSNRHDKKSEASTDPNAGRGTVSFADGHGEFIRASIPRSRSIGTRTWIDRAGPGCPRRGIRGESGTGDSSEKREGGLLRPPSFVV